MFNGKWWFWSNYQYVLAFLFAIEEINKNPNLLPNISLGSDIYNALPSEQQTLENALLWLCGGNQYRPNYNCQTQKKSVAIVAGTTLAFSAQIETLLELYKIPQLHPFLKKIQFANSAGDHVSLDEKRKQIAHYDIKNIVKSGFSWTMVKVGEFSSSPHTEGLVIDEMMIKWPAAFKEVGHHFTIGCTQLCDLRTENVIM
ncbi:Vomeronasal type-2 receptor 26 [Tupaia chinensis]|uniref:Vomeronasal type-2 receptor 26 n=1 Tax=Tupaia chinensis TaxID=246437 RepID=L8YC35_TUPCH|nr:Vomeronasal type-2 receptor 26 [Tupaia chinensis]